MPKVPPQPEEEDELDELDELDEEDEEEQEVETSMVIDDEPGVSSRITSPFLVFFGHLIGFSKPRQAKGCQGSCRYEKAEELLGSAPRGCEASRAG